MALSAFFETQPLFTSMGRRLMPFPRYGLFAETNRLFAEAEARQKSFLDEMGSAQRDNEAQQGQSFSYSSTTIRQGAGDPVTQSTEVYKTADGQVMSRMQKGIGDKQMVETTRDGETKLTLRGIDEAELEGFTTQHESSLTWRPFRSLEALEGTEPAPKKALPEALQHDIDRITRH